MCGIVGAFGTSAPLLWQHLPDAMKSLAHRGPDGAGKYQSPERDYCVGHVRLSIQDLSPCASQPMQRDTHVLAYNGELYNHLQLRNSPPFSLHSYRSHGDTETLLAGMQQAGKDILPLLEGMFAGAHYDTARRTLTLFRDSLGIKPLYYATLPDQTLLFASEIKALYTLCPQLDRRLNSDTLALYFLFENYPQADSLFGAVHLLPPGHCLTCTVTADGVFRQAPLTRFTPSLPPAPETPDLLEATRNTLRNSVHQHLLSDVPLGVYLSGGTDSSSVACCAAESGKPLLGFTGYFDTPDSYYDERLIARAVARHKGIELHEIRIDHHHFEQHFETLVHTLDEPRMGMGTFSQYIVAAHAARHRKVILAGHGGDELFGGYPIFKACWILQSGCSASTLRALATMKAKQWPWLAFVLQQRLLTGKIPFAPILYPRQSRLPQGADTFIRSTQTPLADLQRYYQEVYLPGLLVTEDKISMAHSLETRVPLWTQRTVAFASEIDIALKLPNGEMKGILKRAMAPLLPQEVLTAPKRGFPTPLRLWFRNELHDYTRQQLLGYKGLLHDIIPTREIERLLHAHRHRPLPFALDERRAHRIWMLLCLSSWMRQYRVSNAT